MKKILIVTAIIIIICCSLKDERIIIPNDAIRFRIVGASNSLKDQTIKNNLSLELEKQIYELTKNSESSEETKKILNENYQSLSNTITNYLEDNNVKYNYKINIGRNYFPKKQYKGIKYDAGYYDSVSVELGNHQGVNWWCIIYPPLCLIDDNVTEVEYTTLVKELLS